MKGILVFGDSITFGMEAPQSGGWVGRLKHAFESKDKYNRVYNLGVPGDTSSGLVKRFSVEANARVQYYRAVNKFLIIIAIGINDSRLNGGMQETSPEQFRLNIQQLVDESKQFQCPLLFVSATPVDARAQNYEGTTFTNERIEMYNEIIQKVCQQHNTPYIDIFTQMIRRNYSTLLDDGLHPNSEGYQYIYSVVESELQERRLI
jgi:acyl-CoA thioesterase I